LLRIFGHNYFKYSDVTDFCNQRLTIMDIYQIATTFWDHAHNSTGAHDPRETPPFDPRPEVPVPNIPEESPPFEKEPETPPTEPQPELPPVEPVSPEVEPLPQPGDQPEIPAFR
jgi:hypothetical protein